MTSRLIGLAIVFGLIGFIVGTGGDTVGLFIHIPSLLVVLCFLSGGLLMSYSPRQIISAIDRSISSRKGELAPEALALHLAVFVRAHQLAWAAGLLGSIIGLVLMLQNLGDPSCIGSGIAVSLLSMLYGVILAEFIINPLKHSLIAHSPEAFAELPIKHGKTSKITPGFIIGFWAFFAIYTITSTASYSQFASAGDIMGDAGYTERFLPESEEISDDPGVLLVRSARKGYTEVVRHLLDGGVSADSEELGDTALLASIIGSITCDDEKITRLLLDKGADPNKMGLEGTPLYLAASIGDEKSTRLLISKGADINAKANIAGQSALHIAVQGGYMKVIKLLAANGARLDIKDTKGRTALDMAREDQIEEIKNLFSKDKP